MQGKYNFIKLQKVIIRNFSLFSKKGKVYDIDETINEGVYCLAGANGLGKTTFLNAINYGLTGIVLEPNKEVYSPSEIVKSNHLYTERYFFGRVNKKEEKNAEIELLFSVNNKFFRIIRGFFDKEGLRQLEIYSINNNKKIAHFNGKGRSPIQLNKSYQELLANEMGLADFNYFVFYQLYVLTETRRNIFWDDRASSHAMAIAFNSDPEDADRILDLTRKMEKHESNGRNLRWQATQAKNKIDELLLQTKRKKATDIDKLEKEFNKLYENLEKFEKRYNNIAIEYDTMLKKQSYLNSEIMQLKNEHSKLFSRYSKPRSILLENTNVQLSIKKQECCLCGSNGSRIIENIEKNIHKDNCPLCGTIINESKNSEQNELLKLIKSNDAKIYSRNSELENLINEVDGKKNELEKAKYEFNTTKEKMAEFTEENPDVSFKGTGNQSIDSLIKQYRDQYTLFDKDSKEEYKKRDNLKPGYEKLLKKIESAYEEAEKIFVPTFKKLAKSFIGLDLNIQLKRSDKTIKLVLELNDTARTESFQLSESQRFFLDIALRMSLSIFLSKKENGATMIIDTPEGSLDIAYESRVGNMFADFIIIFKQNIFMTANINASQLLISLAERCGKDKMKFRRMLDWTDPSQIQREGEDLFKIVYDNIEKSLNKKK